MTTTEPKNKVITDFLKKVQMIEKEIPVIEKGDVKDFIKFKFFITKLNHKKSKLNLLVDSEKLIEIERNVSSNINIKITEVSQFELLNHKRDMVVEGYTSRIIQDFINFLEAQIEYAKSVRKKDLQIYLQRFEQAIKEQNNKIEKETVLMEEICADTFSEELCMW